MPGCKLTPHLEVEILNLVSDGCRVTTAAQKAGITSSTMRRWMKEGEAGKQPYADFLVKVEQAQASAIADSLQAIKNAGARDWRAAARHLEIVERQQQREMMSVQRQLEEILQIIEEEIGQDQAKRVLRAIVERFGGAASSEHGATLRLVAG